MVLTEMFRTINCSVKSSVMSRLTLLWSKQKKPKEQIVRLVTENQTHLFTEQTDKNRGLRCKNLEIIKIT